MKPIEQKSLSLLLEGFTHFVNVGKEEDAAIFYAGDSHAYMRLPKADYTMKGQWSLVTDGYFIKWQGGPEGKWQIAHAPGRFVYINPEGKEAGRITRIVPGDAASLA